MEANISQCKGDKGSQIWINAMQLYHNFRVKNSTSKFYLVLIKQKTVLRIASYRQRIAVSSPIISKNSIICDVNSAA